MSDSPETLRALLAQTRPKPAHLGYPQATRERIVAWALSCRRTGATWQELATRVGLSHTTLREWARPARAAASAALLPVLVEPEGAPRPSGSGILTSPRGYRVEGLNVEQLAVLLERLG